MDTNHELGHKANLFSAICLGIGTIVGSGWLFASYYSAQYTGPAAIISWIIGAIISIMIAFLLAEISTIYPERSLFARLFTISHNPELGFVLAISNWFAALLIVPSEATATVQYLSASIPGLADKIIIHEHLTWIGTGLIGIVILIYGILNYWGIKSLAHSNNFITIIKLIVPTLTGVVIIYTAFHPGNFTLYKHTVAPYGITSIFSAIVNCGIFYAFYGFSLITIFASELKNPQKNMPIALVCSILICLFIYIILQIAFIGALDPAKVAQGWHKIEFTSPLAQLASLLGINWLALVLYADSALSPSGTGIVYSGSGARMLNSMAEDGQMPKFFASLHPQFKLSRSSLIFTLVLAFLVLLFFSSWQKIMIVITVFQLISCIAVPVSFTKLRNSQPNMSRWFKVPFGKTISLACFLILSYLLIQSGTRAIVVALFVHVLFFIVYCMVLYKFNFSNWCRSFASSWTMFGCLVFTGFFSYLQENGYMQNVTNLVIFLGLSVICYFLMIHQKNLMKN